MEQGVTLPRLYDLVEVYQHFRDLEQYEYGVLTSIAVNSPKDLKDFDPARRRVTLDYDELPGMLKIPQKRPKTSA